MRVALPSRARAAAVAPILVALLALTSAAAGDAEEIALIDDIVVDGQRSAEPSAEALSVRVAATGETLAGHRGMGLVAGDEVRTGAGVQVVLRFLDPTRDVDPLVFIDQSSAYEMVDSNTLEGFFGRLFASVAGLFSVITPGGKLGVEGTELEVVIGRDGAVDVQMLEGFGLLEQDASERPRRIEPLERLGITAARVAGAPRPLEEDEVVAVLTWTDDVFVTVQPSYPAAGYPAHFDDTEQRSAAFRGARYQAVWKHDPGARARLGNVYADWGEDQRASRAYRQAAAADRELGDSAEFVAGWAEANRRAGRLGKAEEQARRAVGLDPRSGHAHLALGNVYQGIGSTRTESAETAIEYLERAVREYEAAGIGDEPAGTGDEAADSSRERRTRAVAYTNMAETLTVLATEALTRGETETADRRLVEAERAARAATEADPGSDSPFLLLAQGRILQEQARLDQTRGEEAASRQRLEEAQVLYSAALERHRDLAVAHYRIGTVYEDKSDQEGAEREYQAAIATQPTFSPAYDRLGKLQDARTPGSGASSLERGRRLPLSGYQVLRRDSLLSLSAPVETPGRGAVPLDPAVSEPAGSYGVAHPPTRLATVTVPDLRCKPAREAVAILREMGLDPGSSGEGPEVVRQSPAAATKVAPGAEVTLVLGRCSG